MTRSDVAKIIEAIAPGWDPLDKFALLDKIWNGLTGSTDSAISVVRDNKQEE